MKKRLKIIVLSAFGYIFILIGTLGLFLPLLSGIIFLTAGFYLVSLDSEWAKRKFNKLKNRSPRFESSFQKFDYKFKKSLGIDS